MVKLQKTKRGTYIVSVPKKYVRAQKWREDEEFALCPGDNGVLRLIPLFKNGV